ncbi:MAG TPA: LuxR C-terminal-related transcriptional regulator [Streptosporangiaceae bacterium]
MSLTVVFRQTALRNLARILSHRTVATHVSHILGKLDVRSRTDIAHEAVQRQSALPIKSA